jgi:hypothetical protein
MVDGRCDLNIPNLRGGYRRNELGCLGGSRVRRADCRGGEVGAPQVRYIPSHMKEGCRGVADSIWWRVQKTVAPRQLCPLHH